VVLSQAPSSALPVFTLVEAPAGSWLANLIEQSGVAINPAP
jgi:hypothetical protein